MPISSMTSALTATATSLTTTINPLVSSVGVVLGIIAKMTIKIPFLKRLFRRMNKVKYVFMPKYKQFLSQVGNEKIKERFLLIDFDDYLNTILSEQERTEFFKFVDKGDSDLYKQISSELMTKIFTNDINTSKKVLYFIDNEKVFKLLNQKAKLYVYPEKPDDADYATMYSSLVQNIKKRVITYKSFSDLENTIVSRL
jgi:hypothetical protein